MPFVNEDPAMEAVLVELRRIAECLERMEKRPRAAAGSGPTVASDADLDGQYGDPEVRKDPPRWDGESHAGKRMSECSADFLACLASFHDWRAENPKPYGNKTADQVAKYARKDAALARGWERRIRSGWKRPGSDETPPPDDNQPAGW